MKVLGGRPVVARRPPPLQWGFRDALELVSRGIPDPVAKLRFLRGSLQRYERLDRRLAALPISTLRNTLYRLLSLYSLRSLLAADRRAVPRHVYARARRSLLVQSASLLAGSLAVCLVVATTLWFAAQQLATAFAAHSPTATAPVTFATGSAPAVAEAAAPVDAPKPSRVWLVERGAEQEQYSNGLRIDTTYAVPSEPRRYRVFEIGTGMTPQIATLPVGILYHTTESDIWPLDESFNERLRDSSQRLLRYLKTNRVYHYLIDRFGRVFRVVAEEGKANHAGHSVWASDPRVYLNLNHAFLGVAFESRWEGGRALPITEAQFNAGRSLTGWLRQRYDIASDMCVAHGIASINPKKHLIGHHIDWARGFPFEAFGLPDQYSTPSPAVSVFGFGYDEGLTQAMGTPWPGVMAAERELEAAARSEGTSVAEMRERRQKMFDQWLSDQVREQDAARAAAALPRSGTSANTASGG